MSVPFHRCVARGEGRRRGALVNPFIYLFMCHGGEHGPGEGVRDAAYSRRMHRTGNPTGEPARDEGMAKVTGNVRGYSTLPSQKRVSRRSGYTGCLLIRAYFLLKCIKRDFSLPENLNET